MQFLLEKMIFCNDCSYPLVVNDKNLKEGQTIECYFCGTSQKFSDVNLMKCLKIELEKALAEQGFFNRRRFAFTDTPADRFSMQQVDYLKLKSLVQRDFNLSNQIMDQINSFLERYKELENLRHDVFTQHINEAYHNLAKAEE